MSRKPPRLPAFVRLDPFIGWSAIEQLSTNLRADPATGSYSLGYPGSNNINELTEAGGSFGGLTLPTGVAIDREGTVLVADPESARILRNPHTGLFPPPKREAPPCPPGCDCHEKSASDEPSVPDGFAALWESHDVDRDTAPIEDACTLDPAHLQPPGPHELIRPVGLAFNRDGDLVVVDQGDETRPARLLIYTWPALALRHEARMDGLPVDVAVDPEGRILVADFASGRILRFDRSWRLQDWPGGADHLHQPRHLMVGSEGSILVVDSDPASGLDRLSTVDEMGRASEVKSIDERAIWQAAHWPPPIQERGGKLFAPGNPCLDKGRELLGAIVDRRGRLPQGPQLVYRPRRGGRFREGKLMIGPIDSEVLNFAWHRMLFDFDLGPADVLDIRTYTDATALEPERINVLPNQAWSRRTILKSDSTPELLIQSPPGRYLWIEIGFIGDGTGSPWLNSIDIIGPRKSSLRFLPAPFHEDAIGRDFLDRFLSYFDTIFDEIGADIEKFSAQLTPAGAPEGEYLAWLLSWFDIEVLASWNDATRRAFLANAMRLHRARGTISGLTALIRLHCGLTDPMPVLIEGFRLKNMTMRHAAIGADLPDDRLRIGGLPIELPSAGGELAHRFVVVVPSAVVDSADARDTLVRLVDLYRPAHTQWRLIVIEPGLRVGCQSMVGVDTLIGTYPSAPLGEMHLGQSSTTAPPPSHVLRIGDARLNSTGF